TRNDWLRSYTMGGGKNDPEFAKDDYPPGDTRGFWGTTDQPKSVLRFERRLAMCEGTQRGCETDGNCTGRPCESRCAANHGEACSLAKRCKKGVCGKAFDYSSTFKVGHCQ